MLYLSRSTLSPLLCSHQTKGNYFLELGIYKFHKCFQIFLCIYHRTPSMVWGDFYPWNELTILPISFWNLLFFTYRYVSEVSPPWHMLVQFIHLLHLSFVQQLIGICWWTSILIMRSFFSFSLSETESTLMSISGIFRVRTDFGRSLHATVVFPFQSWAEVLITYSNWQSCKNFFESKG